MKRLLSLFVLMCITAAFAQQSQSPGSPPNTTPPTFPENQGRDMPPDTKAPPSQESSTAKVAVEIQEELKAEPALTNANVIVKADDSAVMLSGTVDNDAQRDLAIRIAKSYAGKRKVVDKIQIRKQT
jgi:hypothetical protein